MAERFAAVVMRRAGAIVVGWVTVAALLAFTLPTLEEAQTGSLGDLVPLGADAIDAEQRSAELFAFPFSSRTVVVERDPGGLSAARLARTVGLAADVNTDRLPELRDAAGAYGVTNAFPGLTFAREDGTAALTALLFGPEIGQAGRTARAENYERALRAPDSSYVGVTGAVPARAAQAEAIRDRLPLVELATIILVSLAVGLYLKSVVAPVVTVIAVVISYLTSVRAIALAGETTGISVPAEVEPVLVALLFGVVTDYALFFMSRFRVLVAGGTDGREAARRTTAELTPIIITCGIAVAGGSAALAIADLGFLKAFGPGMALAVLVGMVVVVTLLPALLALAGPKVFWPSSPAQSPARLGGGTRTTRVIRTAVERPKATLAGALALIALMGAGVAWLELGQPVIRGLPADSEPREAYAQVSRAFAPGVVSPATLVVERRGITSRRRELVALQRVLADQPGIAGVVGPATRPGERELGAVLSRTGDAARFVLIADDDPLGAAAIRRQRNLIARIDDLLTAVGLPGARASFAGDTALVAETVDAANDDLGTVLPAVLVVVALVLAVFLRALVAPVYLVLLAALAPLAALGLAVVLFQGILGYGELTYFVPIVAVVLLVSLGSDYNVFIAGSIWAQARRLPLREAVVSGGSGAAHAIAAAGTVLAASFAALALVPIRAFQELGFVLAVGLLIDAFLIRLVIAPAVIVLVEGRRRRRRFRRAVRGSRARRTEGATARAGP
jgi:RND superfamily putative drug exporter